MSSTEKMTKNKSKKGHKKVKDGEKSSEAPDNDAVGEANIEKTTVNKGDDDGDDNVKGRIDVHTLNYFKRVEKLLDDDAFDDKESKELFLNNVLSQVGKGLRTCQLAKHRLTSKILESLFEMCSSEQFSELFESLMEDILTVARDRFGSHVVQKAVSMILKHVNCNNEDVADKIETLFSQFVTELKKNVPNLIRDTYSSHIVSSVIQVLAGIQVSDNVTRSRNSRASRGKFFKGDASKRTGTVGFGNLVKRADHAVPEKFKKKLHKLTKRIVKDFNFGELLCHKNASAVIQILLLALKESEERSCQRLCSMIVEKSKLVQQNNEMSTDDMQKRVPILFADEVGSHVMEKIFYVASGDLYETIFANCFKMNMLQLSLHPLANYIVQHMLSNIPTAEMASAVLEELNPFMEDILASGNMGVVIRLAELSQRFNCKQKDFLNALMKAVHLPSGKNERKSILKLLLTLTTYDVMFEKPKADEDEDTAQEENKGPENEASDGKLTNATMNYHGACLSKVLFLFEDPKILVKSLLSLSEEVLFLTRHEYGSFVVEEFIASQSVSKSYKRKFLLMVKDSIVVMATDKFGSHVVDKLWNSGTEDERKIIKEELFKHRGQLKGNMYGRIVLRNCGIDSFHIPNKTTSSDRTNHTQSLINTQEKGTNEKKKKKKRKTDDINKIENVIINKKIRKDFTTSYDHELHKLGIGIGEHDAVGEELKESKVKDKVGNESSKEIEELFAKGSIKKKEQAQMKGRTQ